MRASSAGFNQQTTDEINNELINFWILMRRFEVQLSSGTWETITNTEYGAWTADSNKKHDFGLKFA